MPPQDKDLARWFVDEIQPHEAMLRAWLRGRFSLGSNVDDIVQEAYLRAIKAREKGALHSPKAFLFKAARNLSIDYLRK